MAAGQPAHLTHRAVLLHGFTGAGASWDPLREALASRGIDPVTPDLPGHGANQTSAVAPPGLDDALRTIRAAVAEAARRGAGRPPVLLGYSMGGRLALHYAHRWPEELAGLVLESASPGLEDDSERQTRAAADRELAQRIRSIGVERFSREWSRHPLFASQRSAPGPVLAAVERQRLASDPEGLAGALEGLGTGVLPSLWEDLRSVRIPTLVLAGSLDEKFAGIAHLMSERLKGADLRIIPGAGHRVHLEAPDAWCDAVSTFVSGLAPPGL